MDIIQAERDFTAWIAGKLDLTVDTDIFRGGYPAEANNAVGVLFGSEIKDNYPTDKIHNVQILGKFADRDSALAMVNTLSAVIPCYGDTINITTFKSITPRSSGNYPADDDGAIKHFASVNIIVAMFQ